MVHCHPDLPRGSLPAINPWQEGHWTLGAASADVTPGSPCKLSYEAAGLGRTSREEKR